MLLFDREVVHLRVLASPACTLACHLHATYCRLDVSASPAAFVLLRDLRVKFFALGCRLDAGVKQPTGIEV
jgi:hypothetical protein